jgi:hypothetical protein
MRLFSKKPTESEARQALQDAIKAAIASAREAGLHPAVISNVLSGYSGEGWHLFIADRNVGRHLKRR